MAFEFHGQQEDNKVKKKHTMLGGREIAKEPRRALIALVWGWLRQQRGGRTELRQKKNPGECWAFAWVHGKGRGIGKCRRGVGREPDPRRALAARLGFLEVRETARNPDEHDKRSSRVVAVTERWKERVETEKEPRRMLSICLGSGKAGGIGKC